MGLRVAPTMVAAGVDASYAATEAARYAALAAHARGLRLVLAHAYTLPPHTGVPPEGFRAEALMAARGVVEDVLSQVRIPPTLRVDVVVELGGPDVLLRRLSAEAALVVIGQHAFDLADQLVSGPVASVVAGRSECPVVVVPPGWSRVRPGVRTIAVALDGDSAARSVLDFAFDVAELNQAPVLALHTVGPADGRNPEQVSNIAEVIAGQKQDHPDVAVSVMVVPGEPRDVVLSFSRSVGLMVLGRPRGQHSPRAWSHSVAQAVLGGARCPLAVVPERRGDWLSGDRVVILPAAVLPVAASA